MEKKETKSLIIMFMATNIFSGGKHRWNDWTYRMNIDGTQIETIAIGNITNIHCTSKYTFFQYYEDQGVLYRVSTSGADTSVEQITIK